MSRPSTQPATITALKQRFAAARSGTGANSEEPKVQKNLRLPESAAKHLAALAKSEGLSQAALIVKALDAYAAGTTSISE